MQVKGKQPRLLFSLTGNNTHELLEMCYLQCSFLPSLIKVTVKLYKLLKSEALGRSATCFPTIIKSRLVNM